ncbi:MAG TPA: Uma2 family endonuclease [Polyangia bacterium]
MKVPEPLIAEILDGELIQSPRPGLRHATSASVLGAQLLASFHGPAGGPGVPGGWWILFEPELHLHGDVAVPDLAGWRHERMPVIPDVAFVELPPDWVCEVVSPRREEVDRVRKMPMYARERVQHLWLVNPVERTLEVYGLEAGRWVVVSAHAGDERVRAAPFTAVELDMARWWIP